MCAQAAPSVSSRLAPLCSSFLPVLNPVVIPGLRAGICCAVLRGIFHVGLCIILRNQCTTVKLD